MTNPHTPGGIMTDNPTHTPLPAEPEIGHTVWHRGWEISYDVEASLWGAEGWRAYKGGPDLDAPYTSARTFSDLIEEIDAEETPL